MQKCETNLCARFRTSIIDLKQEKNVAILHYGEVVNAGAYRVFQKWPVKNDFETPAIQFLMMLSSPCSDDISNDGDVVIPSADVIPADVQWLGNSNFWKLEYLHSST